MDKLKTKSEIIKEIQTFLAEHKQEKGFNTTIYTVGAYRKFLNDLIPKINRIQ